jgi:protein-S-isoprenylcysteine O-methyltransferase Ste14
LTVAVIWPPTDPQIDVAVPGDNPCVQVIYVLGQEDCNQEKRTMSEKKVLPPTCLVSSIIAMLVLYFVFPVSRIICFPWNLLGIVPLAIGIILNLVADGVFKKTGTTVKPFEESTTLITTGVFRISRHPMYVGMVLILIGIAVLLGSLTPYAVILVFIVLMEIIFIRAEERMLQEKFGEAWLAYKEKVRRWI